MFVFLPNTQKTTADLVKELNTDNWSTWMNEFQETEKVNIALPKFKFKYDKKLNDILTDMGMGVAFSDGADFTGINPAGQLKISFVRHKTFVEVNEEGTEAAAVTIVGVVTSSAGPNDEVDFIVNRPFLFAITEKDTGAILFIGEVTKPEYEE